MKRKLLGIAVMAVVAVVATFGYLQNKKGAANIRSAIAVYISYFMLKFAVCQSILTVFSQKISPQIPPLFCLLFPLDVIEYVRTKAFAPG